MNLRFLNWQMINETAEWDLTLQYHKYSEYSSYSKILDTSRKKMIAHFLQNFKQDITTGKRYFSSEIFNVDDLTKSFENKIRVDLQTMNNILYNEQKLIELNISDSNLKLFNQYFIVCNKEKNEVKVYYYNFNNKYYETVKTASLLDIQQVLIEPNEAFEIASVITFNLRFLVEFYGESAYRLGLLESGAVIEEILKSQSTYTQSVIRFKDQRLNALLNLRGNAEIPLAILL